MILIVPELNAGKIRASAREIVTAARALSALGTDIHALLLGPGAAAAAPEMATFVSQVSVCEDAGYEPFKADVWTAAVAKVATDIGAKAVILSASRSGLSYAPRVAVRIGAGLLEDVIEVDSDGATVAWRRQ